MPSMGSRILEAVPIGAGTHLDGKFFVWLRQKLLKSVRIPASFFLARQNFSCQSAYRHLLVQLLNLINRVPVRLDGAARGDAQLLGMLPEIIIAAETVKAGLPQLPQTGGQGDQVDGAVLERTVPNLLQFFAEQEMVELSPELRELFENWMPLAMEQKAALLQVIKTMNMR